MHVTSTTDPQTAVKATRMESGIATIARSNVAIRKTAFWSSLAVAPAVIGFGVAALSRSKKLGVLAGGMTVLGIATVRWQLDRLFNDEPDYVVERRIGKLELRRYPAHVEARTRVEAATFEAALQQGFRTLAGYIFGRNTARDKIAMTSPVVARAEQLAITSPVVAHVTAGKVTVAFVMPPGRQLAALPRPDDPGIELCEVPERRVAVLRRGGRYSAAVVREHEQELLELVSAANLATTGAPMFAGFDPPWTLPLLRRNETWIELL